MDRKDRIIQRQNNEILLMELRLEELERTLGEAVNLIQEIHTEMMTELHTCALFDDKVWVIDQELAMAHAAFEEDMAKSLETLQDDERSDGVLDS